jgi:hypothetical protein
MQTSPTHPAATAINAVLSAYPDFKLSTLVKPDDPPRKLLSTEETLIYLGGITRMTLWRMCRVKKQLTPVRIGSRQMFDIEEIKRFINRQKKSNKMGRA